MSGNPKAVAQLICRRISCIRSGEDASRMPPHSTQPGGMFGLLQLPVEVDRVHVHPGERRVGAQLADQARAVKRRTARQLRTIDEHDIGLAPLGQVVGDARAADTPTDDHDRCSRTEESSPLSVVAGNFRSRPLIRRAAHGSGAVTRQRVKRSEPAPRHLVAARLQLALDQLPMLAGSPRTAQLLEGGLTNVNVKVTTPDRMAVLRLSSSDGDLLAIDRAAENTNSRRAAESGAAPAVLDYLPDLHVLVVEWVEGRTLQPEDLREEGTLVRAAEVCRLLHTGPRFDGDFDMFRLQQRYLSLVLERGFRLPPATSS